MPEINPVITTTVQQVSLTVTPVGDNEIVEVQAAPATETVTVGVVGPQGPPGATGPTGADGATGVTGPVGIGSPWSVTIISPVVGVKIPLWYNGDGSVTLSWVNIVLLGSAGATATVVLKNVGNMAIPGTDILSMSINEDGYGWYFDSFDVNTIDQYYYVYAEVTAGTGTLESINITVAFYVA